MTKVEVTNKQCGFLGLLTLVFVIAKLMGVINWSWYLVFLPMYILPAIFIAVLVIGLVISLLYISGAYLLDKFQTRKKKR